MYELRGKFLQFCQENNMTDSYSLSQIFNHAQNQVVYQFMNKHIEQLKAQLNNMEHSYIQMKKDYEDLTFLNEEHRKIKADLTKKYEESQRHNKLLIAVNSEQSGIIKRHVTARGELQKQVNMISSLVKSWDNQSFSGDLEQLLVEINNVLKSTQEKEIVVNTN